jgi:hypothetical protein
MEDFKLVLRCAIGLIVFGLLGKLLGSLTPNDPAGIGCYSGRALALRLGMVCGLEDSRLKGSIAGHVMHLK